MYANHNLRRSLGVLLALVAIAGTGVTCHERRGLQTFASPLGVPIALSPNGEIVYVLNTPLGRLDLLDTTDGSLVSTISVGLEPVGLAVKPDGSEVWVANHVSDSVSVVDVAAGSPTRYTVTHTIQTMDANLVTSFDEPVGVVFASNAKAYVSLSSRNQIAVVNTATYAVTNVLQLNAQEPRAMVVHDGRLFVPVFESGNGSELSTCGSSGQVDGDQCTFNLNDANFATNPQLVGFPVDIVIDPNVPDRDLFVFDTATDAQLDVVDTIGTLLYGIAIDSTGRVFIPQTDARNAVNGRAGTLGHGLPELQNRAFLNQIGVVDCATIPCSAPSVVDLEVAPPAQPAAGTAMATPQGIAISEDDNLLVVTAASSHRIATVDAASGAILGQLDVGMFPRGVALVSDGNGAAETAYIYNSLDNTVTVVDVSDPGALVETAVWKFSLDPTPDEVVRGRIAFEAASASTSGTFSCGSCHPDGHTDQLLWVIGASCSFGGCNQEEARSTMPVRGLRDTLPLHWDGVLGDPFGGNNGEVGPVGNTAPNCLEADDATCFRQLVDAALAGVMCDTTSCPTNEIGLPGGLSEQERDDMATFLATVVYPPARSRAPDDTISTAALDGFSDFFENQGGVNGPGGGGAGPETCADAGEGGCHPAPFTAGTNSFFVGGFDAPTMRGITDRYLQFSAGITNVNELLVTTPFTTEFPWFPGDGFDEFLVWSSAFGDVGNNIGFRGFYNVGGFDIFQMVEESSTGHSGAFGRQVTLNASTASDPQVQALLAAMEAADLAGVVNLGGNGQHNGLVGSLTFAGGAYELTTGPSFSPAGLLAEAGSGALHMTLTANLRSAVGPLTAQPGIGVPAKGNFLTDGALDLPILPADNPMLLEGIRIRASAGILVDGLRVPGTVTCVGGTFSPICTSGQIQVTLTTPPTTAGLHLLQVLNDAGLMSNELPFRVQ